MQHYPQILHTISQQLRLLAVLLLFPVCAFAQPPAFTLTVTPTDETCPGNGTLTFNVQNTDPTATITYTVYELPDTVNPISLLSTNTINGLTHGDYLVVATQTLASQTNSQTQNAHIAENLVSLAYTISDTPVTCNDNGTMTITVFSGIGVMYEIISGPVIRAPQASPVFSSLPPGVYEVRVFDNCGEGWVATHSLFYDSTFSVAINAPQEQALVTCTSTTITNVITPPSGMSLNYPLTVIYTVFPPGGGTPTVITSTINSGDLSNLEITTVIPYYDTQAYSYSFTITDACNKVYNSQVTAVNTPFIAALNKIPAKCGKYMLNFIADHFLPPLTINFLSAPPGFNPVAFNSNHPGPFTTGNFTYGTNINPVPFGTYSAQITDGCGRTKILDITLEQIDPIPNITLTPNLGCDSGKSNVKIHIQNYPIAIAIITSAPDTYQAPLPSDVSASITAVGDLNMDNMPAGHYNMTLTDDCGNIYEVEFTVSGLLTNITSDTRTGCELGHGSVRIRGSGVNLVSASIESAPPEFTELLPYDASADITVSGIFSMNNLPQGDYMFKVKDECGVEHTRGLTVTGYALTNNTYSITEHCGSFDLNFSHVSNGNVSEMFFLQKYNPATGSWMHPQTNQPYVEGTEPDSVNSYPIINNTTNFNITYLGDFRIIKRFETYENGSTGEFKTCIEVIQSFTFNNTIRIIDIEKNTCTGQSTDIVVTAEGVAPLTYKITSKNGQPFFVDNGINNIFTNLSPAVYNFLVSDPCNNISNRLVDVAQLPSPIVFHQPPDMVLCDGEDHDGFAIFDFNTQTPIILGNQIPANYMVSYHTSLADAINDVNPLSLVYTSSDATIFARLGFNGFGGCFETGSFHLIVNPTPIVNLDQTAVICEGKSITLIADGGSGSYLWSTGATTHSIIVDAPGVYTVTVSETRFRLTCSATASIEVILSSAATIKQLSTTDFTTDENVITVILDGNGIGAYSYSLDNIHFQDSNTFYGLPAGGYTVYVNDNNGCKTTDAEVFLLTYPKFFTPNDDGYNDFWQIKFSDTEPSMKVYVFDRYGKLITGFDGSSAGWDGKYNEHDLPSTDYWFLVVRPNGKEYRGHFTMKR